MLNKSNSTCFRLSSIGFKKILCFFMMISCCFLSAYPLLAKDHVYKKYTNARYKFSVDYPTDLLTAGPEPVNGDGLQFNSKDSTATLVVFGCHNTDEMNISDLYKSMLEEKKQVGEVTYKKLFKNSFVISGKHQEEVFYIKVLLKDEVQKHFEFKYLEKDKSLYDRVVERIAPSFHSTF